MSEASQWLQDTLAAIKNIALGDPEGKATAKAVKDLQTQLASDEIEEAEMKQVVDALVAQLAAAPANPEAPTIEPTGAGEGA